MCGPATIHMWIVVPPAHAPAAEPCMHGSGRAASRPAPQHNSGELLRGLRRGTRASATAGEVALESLDLLLD